MKYISVNEINRNINENRDEFIRMVESNYHNQLNDIAKKIMLEDHEKPVVLVSGPSGSGKTTSSLIIEKRLTEAGHKAQTISLDNYFLPKDAKNMPFDEYGNIDLESPRRLDIDLLHNHIKKLIDGERIDIPIFDFKTQMRTSSVSFRREKGHVILIEGIHALNPSVVGEDVSEHTIKVYVSVRTRIRCNDGTIIHPRKIRLMRRLIRDKMFRGRRLEEIFDMFKSVSRGEDLYIMPYKKRADFDIDTFISYEPSAYKNVLLNDLLTIESGYQESEDYKMIIQLLSEISSIPIEIIDNMSLIREFIGGGSL
ncbi:MAG: nucleoside kinase [Clostridiales bacterium]|nr:nucleoside kinase [Clostridiales bacterium]